MEHNFCVQEKIFKRQAKAWEKYIDWYKYVNCISQDNFAPGAFPIDQNEIIWNEYRIPMWIVDEFHNSEQLKCACDKCVKRFSIKKLNV